MTSMYTLRPISHVSKYCPSFLHVTNTCKACFSFGGEQALRYDAPMKTIYASIKRGLSALLEFFSAPPRRGQCPHCGGGKCYGACQFVPQKDAGKNAE